MSEWVKAEDNEASISTTQADRQTDGATDLGSEQKPRIPHARFYGLTNHCGELWWMRWMKSHTDAVTIDDNDRSRSQSNRNVPNLFGTKKKKKKKKQKQKKQQQQARCWLASQVYRQRGKSIQQTQIQAQTHLADVQWYARAPRKCDVNSKADGYWCTS